MLLAALLMLGLPFLYTQSTSVGGSRAYADSQKARIGAESARNLATALAAYAMTPYLRAPRPTGSDEVDAWTSLEATLSHQNPNVPPSLAAAAYALDARTGNRADDDGSLLLRADGLGLGFNDTPPPGSSRQAVYLGASITDESGKFDPNTMGPVLWARLLQVVGIQDWDDNEVYDANPLNNPSHYICDVDTATGMLAKALAGVRLGLPGRRITRLEQLLLADPQQHDPATPKRLRFRLVRAELERLRPYLTLHNPRPGRDGLVDLGTVVRVDQVVHPSLWLDAPPEIGRSLLSVGTLLVGESLVTSGAHQLAMVNGQAEDANTTRVIAGMSVAGLDAVASEGGAVAIQTPATLDIHQLSVAVRTTLGATAGMPGPIPKPDATGAFDRARITTIGSLAGYPLQPSSPLSLLDLINPVRFGTELPPLGIASNGVFTIESAATVTNPLGRQSAQDSRTEVVQAIPQEYLLERRWTTQGAFQALVASRFASRMQSWPVAIERRLDAITHAPVPPDDVDPATGIAAAPQTGLRPRILADIATVPFAPDSQFPERLCLQHLVLDWRAVFGGAAPASDAQIFDAECFTGPKTQRIPALNAAALAASEAVEIHPDGYHHRAASRLLYPLATDFTTDATNQRTAMLIERDPADPTHEMGARHISLWVKPDRDWDTSQGLITLLEARMPPANAPAEIDQANLGSSSSQNYFGLLYDAAAELLIVALAPPSIEHTHAATFGPLIPADDLGTPWVDERCLAGVGLPLAPHQYADGGAGLAAFTSAYAPNRVLHCFKTPAHDGKPHFRGGQWYHLQLAIASDRPDGVTIIVDGMVGRDAIRTADPNGSVDLVDFGDHCTLPCTALKQAIPYAYIQSGADAEPLVRDIPLLLVRNRIAATGAERKLVPSMLLPSHGMVRIDDEYFSYDSISSDETLTHCVRGRRQDTAPTSPDPTQEFPNAQFHGANAVMAPGGYRLQFPAGWGGRLYQGGCVLGQDLSNGDKAPTSPHPWQVWAAIDKRPPAVSVNAATWRLPASATSIPLSATSGVYGQFPMQGIVLFNGNYFYYGQRDDATRSLTQLSAIAGWAVTPALPSPPQPRQDIDFSASHPDAVLLISIQAQGADPLEEGRYNHSNFTDSAFLLAVQDPSGRVEWIRYDHILRSGIPGVTGGFFLSDSGFDATTRGQDRTAWPGRDTILFGDPDLVGFPGGSSLLLPVQTELGHAGHWLATGDVVTILPRTPSVSASPTAVVPFQMIVRYAASDSYAPGPGPSIPAADATNDYCSFTTPTPPSMLRPQALPITDRSLLLRDYEILCGDCWSGLDLSPVVDTAGQPTARPQPRGNLPRLDLLASLYGAHGSDARIAVASQDPDRTLNPVGVDCTIDDLCAGGLTHADAGLDGHDKPGAPSNWMPTGIAWFFQNGNPTTTVGPALSDLDGVIAMATTPLFNFSLGEMGLVEIDGEVFAYQRPTAAEATAVAQTFATLQANVGSGFANVTAIAPTDAPQIQTSGYYARLVARGLLTNASGGFAHSVGAESDGPYLYPPAQWPHWPILPAIRLPLGPVLMVGDPIAQPWFRLVAQAPITGSPLPPPATMYAPNFLLCSAAGDPTTEEVVQLVGPKIHHPAPPPANPDPDAGTYALAPWLRGLYDTPSTATWGDGSTPTVAIGWWPRYASAMPHDAATTTAAHYRSRTYTWAGFPFALYGMYFSDALLAKLPAGYANISLARIEVDPASLFADGSGDFFAVEARAAAQEPLWSGAATGTQASMDWSQQHGSAINGHPDAAGMAFDSLHDADRCFSQNGQAESVDGAELRVTWRYAKAPSGSLRSIADGSGRSLAVLTARVRGLAPVRVVGVGDH